MKRHLWILLILSLSIFSCDMGGVLPPIGVAPVPTIAVPASEINNLLCGAPVDCTAGICEGSEHCIVLLALTNRAVFDFVKTYSACDGCNTPDFPVEEGIGKCVEYDAAGGGAAVTVKFWVSENCAFRYSDPVKAAITVSLDAENFSIVKIDPAEEYIRDPSFCNTGSDCRCLSGSGVPFTGCRNFLYAPLNWSGYYSGNECGCVDHACGER